jgi:hypothetical protein
MFNKLKNLNIIKKKISSENQYTYKLYTNLFSKDIMFVGFENNAYNVNYVCV